MMVFLPEQNGCRLRCIVKEMSPYIESDTRPINFFKMPLQPKNSHIFGLDL